ncbi:MAG: hypothetical protein K940chlam5_00139 [Candidatus Anoxychlamydiales bacterium]|nr:hypothetical protein [Candidatus Anoxychlamydiales bacterium]
MPNIQLDTVNINSDIQNAHMMKSQIPVSLPVSMYNDDDDSSNNSKKSRKALFNKMQRSSPKLVKTFDEMTVSEKIAYFNSLSDDEKTNLMTQGYNKAASYLNSLPEDKKNALISKINSAVNQSQNGDQPIPSGSQDDSDEGITNIMMILVKAFVKNMNTEALDELDKTFEASLINKFLQNIQNQMKDQIKKQETLNKKLDTSSSFWTPGNIAAVVIGGVVAVLTLGAGVISFAGLFGEAATAAEAGADVVGVGAEEAGLGGENTIEMSETPLSGEESELNSALDNLDGANNIDDLDETTPRSQISDEQKPAGGQSLDEVQAETNKIGKFETAGKDSPKEIDEKTKTRGYRMKRALTRNWRENCYDDVVGKDGKNVIGDNGEEKLKLNNVKVASHIGKTIVKAGMYGGGAFMGIHTLDSLVDKNSPANTQNDINNIQDQISTGTSASDILNNNEQQVSKRISDDSQRISQSSGYVSQAINMLGAAMSFKV